MQKVLSYEELLNEQEQESNITSFQKIDVRKFVNCAHIGNTKCVKEYVEKGMDPNIQIELTGATVLHITAQQGHIETMQYLLSLPSININQLNNNGETALHMSAFNRKTAVVKILIENGIDYTIKDNKGRTALDRCDRGNRFYKSCIDILENPELYVLTSKLKPSMTKVQKNSGIF